MLWTSRKQVKQHGGKVVSQKNSDSDDYRNGYKQKQRSCRKSKNGRIDRYLRFNVRKRAIMVVGWFDVTSCARRDLFRLCKSLEEEFIYA